MAGTARAPSPRRALSMLNRCCEWCGVGALCGASRVWWRLCSEKEARLARGDYTHHTGDVGRRHARQRRCAPRPCVSCSALVIHISHVAPPMLLRHPNTEVARATHAARSCRWHKREKSVGKAVAESTVCPTSKTQECSLPRGAETVKSTCPARVWMDRSSRSRVKRLAACRRKAGGCRGREWACLGAPRRNQP